MRNVVATLFISLDGVVESPHLWSFDSYDDDLGAEITRQIERQDTVLLGRVTYGDWLDFWPTSNEEPYASWINGVEKLVVSSTLESVDWNNASIIEGDFADRITRLKQQDGGDIGVSGSPTLVRSLLELGLLDVLHLQVYPVVVGAGARLFSDSGELHRLELTDLRRTGSGVMLATYAPFRDV